MAKKISLLGIGLKITIASIVYFKLAVILTLLFPGLFLIEVIPHITLIKVGAVFMAVGVPMAVISAFTVTVGFRKGELLTAGIYSVSRNPLYAAWILFIIPGLSLFFKSWLILGTPLAAYFGFKMFIKEEYTYLKKTFGQKYLDYEAAVNELLPFPKLFKKQSNKM